MSIEFEPDDKTVEIARRTAAFVREVVLPAEAAQGAVLHHGPESLRRELQDAARSWGVFAPHVPEAWGGLGLDLRGQAVVFEEAGYSLFGPLAVNGAAPDEGNMHLLEVVADEAQKARYLGPLTRGDIRSCFAMTEPAPGAGSDPDLLATTATPVKGGWRLDGRKWFITGARGAELLICMARTGGVPGQSGGTGATMFLVDADNPGVELVRDIESIDEAMFGGHCEVLFDDCVVGDESVLGEVDRGFHYAQVRLGPARLTHCMRWLGLARRARDIALERSVEREIFGSRLSELGAIQQMLADTEIDLAASRALIWQAAWTLDRGERAAQETSIAKTFVAEAVGRVVDRSVQICGALGVSGDLPLARFLREVRPFRIYDGPSEVHRWSIARRAVRRMQPRALA
ncbi:MAG: acyl-CoA dehydrogenase family protein [Acidimicrobiales bacterium]